MRKSEVLGKEISSLAGMLNVIDTYEEISALRMRRVKRRVLSTRTFQKGLNDTFKRVTYAYERYIESVRKEKDAGFNKNGRTVYILLSSNTGLYGNIVRETYGLFDVDYSSNPRNTDIVIVGRVGRDMFENDHKGDKYSYFEFSDTGVVDIELKEILKIILEYTNIIVYHGMFKSVLSQVPQKTYVTGQAKELKESYEEHGEIHYLFEPSIEEVTLHFENEILALIFEQITYEMALSKFSSRMVNLYSSSENIRDRLVITRHKYRKHIHKVANSKQITCFLA